MYFILCGNKAEAARRAGFGAPGSTAETFAKCGYRLVQDPAIFAAINEEGRKWYRGLMVKSVRESERILDDPRAKDADKLRVADGVLARVDPIISNQVVQVSHEHHHRVSLSADEITKRILALSAKLGVSVPPMIEATAEELPS